MTYAGANGKTAAEMKKVLHLPDDAALLPAAGGLLAAWNAQNAGYTLKIVNRLFGAKTFTFEAPFLDVTNNIYNAPLESLDFAANAEAQRRHINSWVLGQTEDRIKDLVPSGSITAQTRLVVANAVYFLGTWENEFSKKNTKRENFAVNGVQAVKVPMMHQTTPLAWTSVPGARLVRLPYKGGRFAMTIILPNDNNGLSKVEAGLDAATYQRWSSDLSIATDKVDLALPSFKVDGASLPLKKAFRALGMNTPFDAAAADFTKMASPESAGGLYISDAFHKAFVKVDEKGTEATAATTVGIAQKAPRPAGPEKFVVDHPFIFTIDDTYNGAILFLGRVVDPR